ncbi:hypothetical protein CC85DRAFT_287492 [Cutaneotrichosporon oleaginosum]|uniref:Zn(2)-C6 fungal-type domain-containing protein n=1 Tax=Cutaneotrichosporon oleaginosum TaxID=879819 RepID=A0A0J0XHB0_9TREE|nr:uncharacterized protein CC85DRAFT_287492 [Cutaneotrichosporon oleaginosum]KLT40387.1 hypothetical protein CC85DRAFT_287492 [Cutaneotrichosporon oleaginosum]TXT11353.1 hypothetical protein COLE_01763 [Cutaneotrichosporon oleaginosum]
MPPAQPGQPSAMYKYLQDDSGQSTLKKVKCQRACKFCRKSHTTCEDTRPCQRCIKRDIAQLCLQDEADQLAQQAAQQQQQQLAAAAAAGNSNGAKSTIPAKRRGYSFEASDRPPPDRRPSLPQGAGSAAPQYLDSASAGTGGPSGSSQAGGSVQTPSPSHPPGTDMVGNVPLPNMMSPQDSFRSGPMSGFDQEMTSPLNTSGRMPQWYDPAFQTDQNAQQAPQSVSQSAATPEGFSWSALVDGLIDPLHSQSPSGEFAWLNANTANTPNGRGLQPNAHMSGPVSASPGNSALKNESPMSPDVLNNDGPVMPYNYTFGYSRLKSWANSMTDPVKVRVNAATDKFKPILHSCLSQYSEEQIISVEVQFLAYVRNWSTFCDTIPAPACIWRRTGEIYAANKRMLALMDMTPQTFRPGKSALYNVSRSRFQLTAGSGPDLIHGLLGGLRGPGAAPPL